MFKILPNEAIDRSRWDSLVNAQSGLIYGQSWFLDATVPGWCALIDEYYSAGIPLITARKFGQPYVYQPLFAQRFEGYFRESAPGQLQDLLDALPEYFRYIEIHLNLQGEMVPSGFRSEMRSAQVLPLLREYKEIQDGYEKGLRYSLRKAGRLGVEIRKEIPREALESFLLKSGLYRDQPVYQQNHKGLMRLIEASVQLGSGQLWGAYVLNNLVSVAFILEDDQRVYFLFQYSSHNGRECCAAHLLTDALIQTHAGKKKLFDFVGSMLPSVAFFNNQFGAEPEFYQRITAGSPSVSHCIRKTLRTLLHK